MDHHTEYILSGSTLADLREVVAASADLPDTATVRAQVGFGNLNGAKIRKIRIADDAAGGLGRRPPSHE